MPSQAKRVLEMHSVCKYNYHIKLRIPSRGNLCSKSTLSFWSSISQTLNHSVKMPVSLTWPEMLQKITYLVKMHSHTWNAAAWSQQFNLHESQTDLSAAGWANYLWFLTNLNNFCQVWSKFSMPPKNPKLNREKVSRKHLRLSEGSLEESGSLLWNDIAYQNLAKLRGCVLHPPFTRSTNTI